MKKNKDLYSQLPEDFFNANFEASEYTNAKGKTEPYYRMTRDGYSILVMGFTDKKAIDWKIKYIAAFNAMAEATGFDKSEQFKELFPPELFKGEETGPDTDDLTPEGGNHVQ